jgi:glycosyltransferase involved in cell wall biosynthesis
MKILFVTNLYPTVNNPDYGVFTKDQIDNVCKTGIQSDIIFINARENGIFEYIKAIKKINKSYKDYDIIHCFHGLSLLIVYLSTKRIKILASFLSDLKYESLKNNKIINSIIIKFYLFVINKKRVYTIFKHKIPNYLNKNVIERSFYLPNGVDLNDFYPINKEIACNKLNLDFNKTYLLFVSSKDKFRKEKRYDVFKQVIDYLKLNCQKYDIEELVLSNVPRELCIYYFNASSVHILTSDYEGSPNSIKESLSCNIPIVSTNVGNVERIIEGSKNCFITNQNPVDIAKKVMEIFEMPKYNLREILTNNKLTVEQKTNELIDIYNKILLK